MEEIEDCINYIEKTGNWSPSCKDNGFAALKTIEKMAEVEENDSSQYRTIKYFLDKFNSFKDSKNAKT